MTRITIITALLAAASSTALADGKTPTLGVVVADEAEHIFMDKRTPEEREADEQKTIDPKTGKVIVADEAEHI